MVTEWISGYRYFIRLTLVALLAWTYFPSLCETAVLKTSIADDRSVKATVYTKECGAAGATRTFVALSSEKVDGSKNGEIVVTLVGATTVDVNWVHVRHLLVEYSEGTKIEYAVTKTRGITVELANK